MEMTSFKDTGGTFLSDYEIQNTDTSTPVSKLDLISNKLDDVKGVMCNTIDNILERGEKLEVLVDKTENLESSAFQFQKKAIHLRRTMLCKKIKTYLCFTLIISIIIWFLSSIICGFDYKKCKS